MSWSWGRSASRAQGRPTAPGTKQKNVDGRSSMNKQQLAKALGR
ncbi:hypothetical protein [Streptomyces sp. NPDC048643]